MSRLVGFDFRKRDYKVKRYAKYIHPLLSCKENEVNVLQISSIQPACKIRVTLISGATAAQCTLKSETQTEVLNLSQFSPELTSQTYSELISVTCDTDCVISLYADEEVSMELGTVEGSIYTERRSLGTDEIGRITLVSTEVLVCLPGPEIKANDILVDQVTGDHYSVVSAQKAFDRKGRLHHWELDVVEVSER